MKIITLGIGDHITEGILLDYSYTYISCDPLYSGNSFALVNILLRHETHLLFPVAIHLNMIIQ